MVRSSELKLLVPHTRIVGGMAGGVVFALVVVDVGSRIDVVGNIVIVIEAMVVANVAITFGLSVVDVEDIVVV